jgi:hypothetical protein
VLPQEPRAGTPKQPSEHERDEDRVVELTRDRDEVGDQVERHGEIDERERRRELPPRRHARIAQEPLEQHGAVRNQPGDHADVPLPRPDHEGSDQERQSQAGFGFARLIRK